MQQPKHSNKQTLKAVFKAVSITWFAALVFAIASTIDSYLTIVLVYGFIGFPIMYLIWAEIDKTKSHDADAWLDDEAGWYTKKEYWGYILQAGFFTWMVILGTISLYDYFTGAKEERAFQESVKRGTECEDGYYACEWK